MKGVENCVLAATVLLMVAAAVSAQESKASIRALGWMAGCWEMNNKERGLSITEMWMKPEGGMMIGAGRTVKGGKTVDFEFLRIVQDETGIAYVPKPAANKEETIFKLIKSSANEVIFENPTHDFPQRIIYRQTKPDTLSARIEGTANGKVRGMDFPYTRARCE